MTPSRVLKRIVEGGLCSGCGACAAIAPDSISMALVNPGFLRPVQSADLSPDQESRITEACPGTGLTQDPAGRWDHLLWGPIVGLRSGYATEPVLRRKASSGGALSAFLLHLLETGAVDGVLQTAAAPDLPIGNATVLSATSEDVFRAAGSRYAPSAPLAGLEQHLVSSSRFALVGKPCDVAALRAMERFDPRIAERIPVMLSFFCAGAPSLSGARKILEEMGVDEAEVAAFRYRGDGWPGFATATLKDGSCRQMSYTDSWGEILTKHVQWRCRICPDGTGGFADIACADAWEADERGYPSFEERDGVSLIVSRTRKGEEIVQAAMAAGRIVAEPFAAEAISAIQPGQTQRRQSTLPRVLALRIMGQPAPVYRGFHLMRNTGRAGLWPIVKNFLGTVRRFAQGRLS
jgi:coenzyme F420 hydrogenase subunit beta